MSNILERGKDLGMSPTIFADRILSFDALPGKVVTSELRVYLRKSRFGFNVELGWEINKTKDRNKLSSNVSSCDVNVFYVKEDLLIYYINSRYGKSVLFYTSFSTYLDTAYAEGCIRC